MSERIKIITCGNDAQVNGGITSVISQILDYNWNEKNIDMKFIPTYYGGNPLKWGIKYIGALVKLIKEFIVDKPLAVHIHMSYKGSFYRANIIAKLCQICDVKTIIHLHGSNLV